MLGAACTNIASAAICSTPQVGCFVLVFADQSCATFNCFVSEEHGHEAGQDGGHEGLPVGQYRVGQDGGQAG